MPAHDPHPGLAAIERLQRIEAALAAGEAPDREDARWLAGCFSRYLEEAEAGLDLDAALGLAPSPGRSFGRDQTVFDPWQFYCCQEACRAVCRTVDVHELLRRPS